MIPAARLRTTATRLTAKNNSRRNSTPENGRFRAGLECSTGKEEEIVQHRSHAGHICDREQGRDCCNSRSAREQKPAGPIQLPQNWQRRQAQGRSNIHAEQNRQSGNHARSDTAPWRSTSRQKPERAECASHRTPPAESHRSGVNQERTCEQHASRGNRQSPAARQGENGDQADDPVEQPDRPFDINVRPENRINAGEQPPVTGSIDCFEIPIWDGAVLDQFRIDQRHAFIHRIAGSVVARREREQEDDQAETGNEQRTSASLERPGRRFQSRTIRARRGGSGRGCRAEPETDRSDDSRATMTNVAEV